MTEPWEGKIAARKLDGDAWEAWPLHVPPSISGKRDRPRCYPHAATEAEAKAKAWEKFAPVYPVLLLSGSW